MSERELSGTSDIHGLYMNAEAYVLATTLTQLGFEWESMPTCSTAMAYAGMGGGGKIRQDAWVDFWVPGIGAYLTGGDTVGVSPVHARRFFREHDCRRPEENWASRASVLAKPYYIYVQDGCGRFLPVHENGLVSARGETYLVLCRECGDAFFVVDGGSYQCPHCGAYAGGELFLDSERLPIWSLGSRDELQPHDQSQKSGRACVSSYWDEILGVVAEKDQEAARLLANTTAEYEPEDGELLVELSPEVKLPDWEAALAAIQTATRVVIGCDARVFLISHPEGDRMAFEASRQAGASA